MHHKLLRVLYFLFAWFNFLWNTVYWLTALILSSTACCYECVLTHSHNVFLNYIVPIYRDTAVNFLMSMPNHRSPHFVYWTWLWRHRTGGWFGPTNTSEVIINGKRVMESDGIELLSWIWLLIKLRWFILRRWWSSHGRGPCDMAITNT